MIIEWKCPKYWNIDLDKLKADGKDNVIIDDGQIVGKIISIEERNNELYAKAEILDKFEKELNDRLYPKCIVSSRGGKMKLNKIIEELEQNLKPEIWAFCENEETQIQKQVKYTTNLLLDLLESLESEVENE